MATKNFKLEATPAQLSAICNAADILSASLGGMDECAEKEFKHTVKMIDRFLNRNGFRRKKN